MTLLAGARILTPEGFLDDAWILTDGEVISEIGQGTPPAEPDVDLTGQIVLPGFIDQHCHGGGGASFVTEDADEARRAARFHLEHGTTSIMASLVSGSNEALKAQVSTLSPLVDDGTVIGVHLEGPWISQHFCGAHAQDQLRAPALNEVTELLELGDGRIRMVTIAPELEGGIEAIEAVADSGALAAVGHTDADYETGVAAVEAGARVITHLFNAMRPVLHRDPNAAGALLEDPRVFGELICDGVHIHPTSIKLALRELGVDRSCMITDAMSATGVADGQYKLGELDVTVKDGVARLTEAGNIAGSTLTLDKALRFVVNNCDVSIEDASQMLSANPARVLGLTDRGTLEPGKRADLLVLQDASLDVTRVMQAGTWI
ncbi:MAG: N-acetylglucosamine-6-phosphate deacetylase [Candidatus Nanopelagicales bacterium]